MKKYTITFDRGWWVAKATDDRDHTQEKFCETKEEASAWIYKYWETTEQRHREMNLLSDAISGCVQSDINRGVEPSLD